MTPRISTHIRRLVRSHNPNDPDQQSVTEFCRTHTLSRDSYYRIKNHPDRFLPQSTAPKSPHRTYGELTWIEVRRFREMLQTEGYDDGPRSIKWEMIRADLDRSLIPSTARIAQYLHDNELARINPKKRPHASYTRFQKDQANELWQLDGFDYRLPDNTVVTIIQLIDDCTRYMLALDVSDDGETSRAALQSITAAIAVYGKPHEILSDNARAFTMQRFGTVGSVDIAMAAEGIILTPGPFHRPQNQGKVESSHKPALKRLRAKNPTTPAEVAHLLGEFRQRYNHERQHLGLGEGITPANAWQAATRFPEPTNPIDISQFKDRYTTPESRGYLNPATITRRLLGRGQLNLAGKQIRFGPIWRHQELAIIDQGSYYEFFHLGTGLSVAKLFRPLPDLQSLTITKHGTYAAGDQKHLPTGIEPVK